MSNDTVLLLNAGICGFKTKVTATSDGATVQYRIESDCPHVSKLNDALDKNMGAFDPLTMPFSENPVYLACGKALAHSACPVPMALIKAAEVAAGLGLKRSVALDFE